MSNNPNPSKAEMDFGRWYNDNENELLEDFLSVNDDAPPVKEWDKYWRKLYDDYVEIIYRAYQFGGQY